MKFKEKVEKRAREIMEDNDINLGMIDEVVYSVMVDTEHDEDESNIDRYIWDAIHDWDLI